MQRFATGTEAALALRPDHPLYCFRPEVLKQDARHFMKLFPGETAYAVKTNGEPMVLKTLVEAGVKIFDVASPGEFQAVRRPRPTAEMLYMHPVKAQSDIRLALETYGIRVMSLDHEDEIAKVLQDRPGAGSRSRPPSRFSCGCRPRAMRCTSCRRSSARRRDMRWNWCSGCTGSASRWALLPCRQPGGGAESYELALKSADWVRNRAGVPLVGLDVGGGFPCGLRP
jgi:ornithine decarboxylase